MLTYRTSYCRLSYQPHNRLTPECNSFRSIQERVPLSFHAFHLALIAFNVNSRSCKGAIDHWRTPIHVIILSRASPSTSNIYPFCQTTALLALYINNICVTSASASYAILLYSIPRLPVLVFFFPFSLVQSGHFKERWTCSLACRCICWAMLNSSMSIPEVSEIVNVSWCKKSSCC